jgi:hypothetical protein
VDIDLTGFTGAQQHALFDLLILAMYADGQLTSIEDEQLQELLGSMGFTEESDRQREFDAAVTRIRPELQISKKPRNMPCCWQRHSLIEASSSGFMMRLNKS